MRLKLFKNPFDNNLYLTVYHEMNEQEVLSGNHDRVELVHLKAGNMDDVKKAMEDYQEANPGMRGMMFRFRGKNMYSERYIKALEAADGV